jgi:hypothetical protein
MIAQLDALYIRSRPKKAIVRLISYLAFEGRPLTTRGRWINPLVFANMRRLAGKPQKHAVTAPIFVIGTGRSGTTVCGITLSMHRDIGFLNEPKALWHTVIPDEDIVGNYTDQPGRYQLSASDASDGVSETVHRLYSGYRGLTGCKRILDKYPEMVFRIPFLRQLFPDAKFILLVRNPDATAGSIKAWSTRHGSRVDGRKSDWWGRDDRKWRCLVDEVAASDPEFSGKTGELRELGNERDRAGLEWLLSMRAGLQAEASPKKDVIRVRYEDFVDDPGQTLSRLFEFCDLDFDDICVAYAGSKLGQPHEYPSEPFHGLIDKSIRSMCKQLGYDAAPDSAIDHGGTAGD